MYCPVMTVFIKPRPPLANTPPEILPGLSAGEPNRTVGQLLNSFLSSRITTVTRATSPSTNVHLFKLIETKTGVLLSVRSSSFAKAGVKRNSIDEQSKRVSNFLHSTSAIYIRNLKKS